jgi:hypothetical protein
MTRDAAAQAVHERLERAASADPAFDVDAGWAALAVQLEGPVAPVIPLRRHHPRRVIALAAAAAIFIGGSAFAMVRHGGTPGLSIAPIVTLPSTGLVTGPHAHPAFSGAPPVATPTQTDHGGNGGQTQAPPTGGSTAGGGTGSSGGSGDTGGGPTHVDSPNDTDHGTGNDVHGDNGKGNNTQGQDTTQGNGNGGGQGSSGDQGSGSPNSRDNGQGNGH